jgi:uncharacterized membrane protein
LRTRRYRSAHALRLESLEDRRTPAIKVAVVGIDPGPTTDNSGFQATVNQLNDSTAFDFQATFVLAAQVDTAAELAAYDAVIIGNSGSLFDGDPFNNSTFTAALRTWVEGGGGVILTGWGISGAGSSSAPAIPDIDAIIPVDTLGAHNFVPSATVIPNATVHEVTAGVTQFTLNSSDAVEYPGNNGVDLGATVLGTASGHPVIVVGNVSAGRGIYLGSIYCGFIGYNNAELRSGEPDQLLEQAVNWVANVSGGNQAPTDIALSANTVAENQPVNTLVGTLSATDPNVGDTFTFSLVAGAGSTDNNKFTISGNELRTSASFDFEAQTSFSIRVQVTDQGGLPFEKVLTGTITNVNEAPTDIQLTGGSVLENQPVNTVVGTLSAIDPDTGNTFTYSLVAGAGSSGNGSFNISGNSLRTSTILDFEAQASYSVRVRAIDQGNLTFEKVFTITVGDVPEAANTPPTLTGVPVSVNVNEGTVIAFDADATDPDLGQTLTFSLDGAPAEATIDSSTGAFSWTPTEAQGPDTFVFNVRVSDGTATTAQTMFAIVRELNAGPTLAGVPATLAVVRGHPVTFTATATDPDILNGLGNALTFSVDGATTGMSVDPETGEVTVRVPDTLDAGDTIATKVRVTDDGVPARTDAKAVVVTALDSAVVNGELLVGGTAGNDTITVGPSKNFDSVVVVLNRVVVATYSVFVFQIDRVVVRGLGGNDKITISPKLLKPADLYGDSGNDALTGGAGSDRLFGGGGNDVLTGGLGNDLLVGGFGNDTLKDTSGTNVLVGGAGSDRLTGGTGDDLLIGGSTAFDTDLTGLTNILAEWTSGAPYTDRVSHLTGTPGGQNGGTYLTVGTGGTVTDDGVKDVLTGGKGTDFFVTGTLDTLDLKAGEQRL